MANDPQPKKPSIPHWQVDTTKDPADSSPQSSPAKPTVEGSPPDHSTLIEQAKAFLRVPSMRDARREEKATFLKEKGLSSEIIEELLDNAPVEGEDRGERTDPSSRTPAPVDMTASSLPMTSNSHTEASSGSEKSIPPIITYPEFLLRPAKPPPLVTLDRLGYAAYTLASISAITYGASKYLIQPMLESLTAARHELSGTALQNLDALNKRLETNVSQIPPVTRLHRGRHGGRQHSDEASVSDVETVTSDPTEFFHRDIATQTSPPRARSSSATNTGSSTPMSSPTAPNRQEDAITVQSARLKSLHQSLSPFLEIDDDSHSSNNNNNRPTSTTTIPSLTISSPINSQDNRKNAQTSNINTLLSTLVDCDAYLATLNSINTTFPPSFSFSSSPYNTPTAPTPTSTNITNTTATTVTSRNQTQPTESNPKVKEDEAAKFKREIRAVKGAMLGVRSFPRGKPLMVGVGVGGPSPGRR